ncbi:DegT/DnrJ/EryC1/StrS family aminotransferase [Bacillus tianshenii]|nr:DegT/DnrJ/EryC1/StrS family aminotransferase [Bacillus tianshenii]
MIRLTQPNISEKAINEVNKVLRSGMLVQGKNVESLETALKEYMHISYALATTSGTAALHLALMALEIKKGDAVFIPAFTFPATANVVEVVGARPYLIDVELGTYNIDVDILEEALNVFKGEEKPKAIIVVHEFGAPSNMTEIMKIAYKYGLYVIEDAACALGTEWNGKHVGTFGDVGCFSWHPRKAITTGEGGAVVTKDQKLFKKLSLLRNHGIENNEGEIDFIIPGLNYRMTEFQAVIGIDQLNDYEKLIQKRRLIVEQYLAGLNNLENIFLPQKVEGHAWQTFMILLSDIFERSKIISELKDKGIESNLGAQAVHLMYHYKNKYSYIPRDFPNASRLYQNGLALPLHPQLSEEDVNYITTSFKEIISKYE